MFADSQFMASVELILFKKSGKAMFYINTKTHYITDCKIAKIASFFSIMTILFKATHSDQIFCRFAVCIDLLVAPANKVLRYAADFVKMMRINVNIYILKSAKKLLDAYFYECYWCKDLFRSRFFAQFCLFCCFKDF